MRIAPGLRVEGRGALQCQVTCDGTIAPGMGPGGIGEVSADQLVLGSTSVLEFDIAGPAFLECDRVQVNSSFVRDGTLRVRLAGGYVPAVGQTFSLITTVHSGQFDTFDAPGFVLMPGLAATVQYVGFPCDPDMTRDGVTDQDDVAYLINVIAGGENPNAVDPDFDRTGVADQEDVAALVNVVAGGGCP